MKSLAEMQNTEKASSTANRPKRRFAVPVTLSLLAANVAVFGWMLAESGSFDAWTADYLLSWGANYAPQTLSGQSWRMFTCLFVHRGIPHLLFNMLMLWHIGRPVEYLIGSTSFFILYMVCGLCSSLAGLWFNSTFAVVGASGALFGLVGSLFAFLLVNHRHLQDGKARKLLINGLLFLGCNLALGLAVKQIDLTGHSAGFCAGFFFGLPLMRRLLSGDSTAKRRRIVLATSIATVLLWLIPRALPAAPPDFHGEMARFIEVEHDCLHQFIDAQVSTRSGPTHKTRIPRDAGW